MELPDLSSLLASLGSETKTGTQYEFGGCIIEIAKDQCKITFLPKKESCHDKLSLGKLFDRFFPKGKLKTLFKDYVPVGVFQIERFVLDKCIGDLDFEAIAKETFDIVKEKLKVSKCFFFNFLHNFLDQWLYLLYFLLSFYLYCLLILFYLFYF